MKPTNYKYIKKYTLIFWAWFIPLVLCAFMPIYLFFESYEVQQQYIRRDIEAYKQILNKQYLLGPKIDSLYALMQLLNEDAVGNESFLEQEINEKKNTALQVLGADSTSFCAYSFLLNRIDTLMALKANIRMIKEQEIQSLSDLKDCMFNTEKIKRELADDPSRHFTAAY